MTLESRLDLRLSQKLIITPQLQQAIKLLQLPLLELSQTLNQELIENPFLEENLDELEIETLSLEERENSLLSEDDSELPVDDLIKFSVDEYFTERSNDGRDLGYFNPGTEEQPSYELFATKTADLWEHLLWQLRLSNAEDNVRKVAEAVIGNIDDDGYLRASEEELSLLLSVDRDTVRSAISLVQTFDPAGVGARDLKECLLIQARSWNLGGTLVEKIILNNMDDLQKKKYVNIAKKYNSPLDDIMTAVQIIEGFEPRPGSRFSNIQTNYIVPDVFINKTDDGYQIILNDEGIPKIRLNNSYKKLLLRSDLSKEDRDFLKNKLKLATELLRNLDQRNRTIYKVSESILKFQKDFFDKGIQYIKPLNLREIALDINMHESTISRVTSNKYLACDHGVFNFRFFFSSAIQSENGKISSTIVKDYIKKLITEEDSKNPLSDQKISEELKKMNIYVARRTVAKYREELKIPSQSQRKRYD
jgi:RNA polymerase sigma-54 factor